MSFEVSIIAAAVIFAGAFATFFLLFVPREKRIARGAAYSLWFGALAAFGVWFGLYGMDRFQSWFDHGYAIVPGLLAAGLLFQLKVKNLRLYAVLECLIGGFALTAFSSHHAAAPLAATLTTDWIAGFAAPVYLLIRGFGNLREGQQAADAAAGNEGRAAL